MEKLQLVKRVNPLCLNDKEIVFIPYEQLSLSELTEKYLPTNIEFNLSINGQIIPSGYHSTCFPKIDDCVVATPKLQDSGSLRMLAFIALSVAAWQLAPMIASGAGSAMIGAAGGGFTGAGWIAFNAASSVLQAVATVGIMAVGGMLINSMLPIKDPDPAPSASQIYSWNPLTTQRQGAVKPKLYGQIKTHGNVIATHTEVISDKNYVNALISLGLGPISEIDSMYINDQPKNNYTGVTVETRYGYLNQGVVTNFNSTKTEYNIGVELKRADGAITRLISGSDYDEVEVDINFPRGIFELTNKGIFTDHEVRYRIELVNVADSSIKILITADAVMDWNEFTGDVTYVSSDGYWALGRWMDNTDSSGNTETTWVTYKTEETAFTAREEGQTELIQQFYYDEVSGGDISYFLHGIWRRIYTGDVNDPGFTAQTYGYSKYLGYSSEAKTKTYRGKIDKKGAYNVVATKLSADVNNSMIGDTVVLQTVRTVVYDDFIYPRETLVGIKALATNQLSGSLNFSCIVKGALIRVYDGASWSVEYNNNPAWVCYDVLTQPVFNDPSYVSKTKADGRTTWYRCILSHTAAANKDPGENDAVGATWRTYWMAADGPDNYLPWALSTEFVIYDHVKIGTNVYRCTQGHTADAAKQPGVGATWATYWTKTSWVPGTAYVDITDSGISRYDGVNPTQLNLTTFKAWADFCDALVNDGEGGTEKRFVFNGGFDTERTLWDAALSIAFMSRASIYFDGDMYTVALDKAETSYVQLFSSGNVIVDSFEEVFLPLEERAGEVEISFANEDRDYDRDTFTIFNTDLDKSTNKISLSLIGTTKPSQAWRTGQFFLLCNQYLKRTIKFQADVDAVACSVGDVINFQHEVPQWGITGGLVVSATSTTLTLDRSVTIEAATTYAVMVRRSDTDTIITKTINNGVGDTTVLTFATPFSDTPEANDVFAFGVSTTVIKPFRVLSYEVSGDLIITLNCVEYQANVYTVDSGTPLLPVVDYTTTVPVEPVTSLSLKEESYFDESGNLRRDIVVSFVLPNSPIYMRANIFYRKYNGEQTITQTIMKAGFTTGTNFKITDVEPLSTYQVYVESESFGGKKLNSLEWPMQLITTTADMPNVSPQFAVRISGLEIFNQGVTTTFDSKDCKFEWNSTIAIGNHEAAGEEVAGAGTMAPNKWLKDYEVIIYDTDGTTVRRTEYVSEANYTYTLEKNLADGTVAASFIIGIKGRSWYYTISSTEAKLTVTNDAPSSVVSLTASSMVGGVLFSWNKNTEEDLQGYYIRTSVGSAAFSDWAKTTDNRYARVLSAAEIAAQTSNALIVIEVKAMDMFEQLSNAETVSAKANIISDNLFQLTASRSGGTGTLSDLYNGVYTTGGITI